MPPKKRSVKQSSASVIKKSRAGRPRGSKQMKKKKRNPWDSGGSSDDEQQQQQYNYYYSDDDEKNDSSDQDIKHSLKNKSKVSVIDGLELELVDEDAVEFDDDDDVDSTDSEELSTSVSTVKISSIETAREKRCVWLEDRDFPPLELPESSEDLLIDSKYVLRAMEIYEICRRFGSIIRLSPFLFEDFCSTLNASNEQSPLLDAIHIAFIKFLLKEDETNQTLFGAFDTKDSINIAFNHLDFMTYGEILRRYVESDERFGEGISNALADCNYPYVDVERRLIVLKWLCDQFLITNTLRNELAAEGAIKHDDHCRECGKTGDLLCCDTCSAVYHLSCVDPPLKETPSSGWQCVVCKLHVLQGVTDCISVQADQLIRQNFLGYDRHGRCFWYLCRRIVAEDVDTKLIWYYSTLSQFRQLLMCMDANDLERELCDVFSQYSKEILHGLDMNEQLTVGRALNRQTWFAVDKMKRSEVWDGDGAINSSQPTELLIKINNVLNESFDEMKKLGVNESPHIELEDVYLASSNGLAEKIPIKSAPIKIAPKTNPDGADSPSVLFKLGMDRASMKYNNYYTSNTLAVNPYQRADERKWERYIANRFSVDGDSEYNWPKEVMNSADKCAKFIRNCLVNISSRLPVSLMHPLWGKDDLLRWKRRINESSTIEDFTWAILKFESNIKPVVLNDSYKHSLGHTKLFRQTAEDKEERSLNDKAKQKRRQTLTERLTTCDPSAENSSVIWVKYSLLDGPPKHEIWKLKDEQYRVNGFEKLGGWIWVRSHRRINYTSYRNYGLFNGAAWESPHSSVIEQMLRDYRAGAFHYDADDEIEFIDDDQPTCAVLPLSLNDDTLEKQIDRPKAAAKLCLNRHLDTINVTEAINRHSLYFKVAKGSKVLDKLLSSRLRQEEKINAAAASSRCYSPTCFVKGGSPTCYSVSCRLRYVFNERRTRLKHRLQTKFDDNDVASSTSPKNVLDDDKILRTPPLHYFRCRRSQKLNIFILPKHVSRSLARNWMANEEISGFNSNCKANQTFWPYPCIRPFFSTCWKYQMAKAKSLHAVALMLRVLFSSIRWSDVLKNVGLDARRSRRFEEYTETREIVKHKSLAPFGLTQTYMVRVICVPHEYGNGKGGGYSDETSDEDYDPHNTSYKLRERRREKERMMNKNKNNKKPTVTVQWIREEDLVMWEIRNYWSTLERRRKLDEFETARRLRESNQINTSSNPSPVASPFRSAASTPRMPGITVKSNIVRTPTSLAAVSRTSLQTPSSVPIRFFNRPAIAPVPTSAQPRFVLAAGSRLITVNNKMITAPPGSAVVGTQSAVRPSLVFVVRNAETGNQQAVRFSTNTLPIVKKYLNYGGSSNVVGTSNVLIRSGVPMQQQQQQTFIQSPRPVQLPPKFYLTNGGDYTPVISTSTPTSSYYQRPSAIADTKQIADEHGFVLTPSAIQQAIKKGLLGADNKETKNKLLSLKKRNVPETPPPDMNFAYFDSDDEYDEYGNNLEDDDFDFDFDNIPNLQPITNVHQRQRRMPNANRASRGGRAPPKSPRQKNPNRSSSSGGRRKKNVDDAGFATTISKGRRKKLTDVNNDPASYARSISRSRKYNNDDDVGIGLEQSSSKVSRRDDTYQLAEKNRLDRKITSDCAVLMRYLIDKVCEKEKTEKRSEKRAMSSELRRQYWKRYRVKRKIKLQYEDQISNRLARWRKEIVKRRQILEFEICSAAKKELDNGGLEALKAARESKREKRLQATNILLNNNKGGKRKRKSSESLKYKTPKKPSAAQMKLSMSNVKLDVGSGVKKSSSKQPKILPVVGGLGHFATSLQTKFDERIRDCPPDTLCLCKKPYDPTKFYVGCDLCSRYFHGKCVGVTAQISKRISVWYCPDCQRERQNAKQELYCICRTPYDESQFYISCDVCDLWFHGKCVGVKPDEGEDIPAFICQECSRNQNGTIQPMIKPLTNRDVQRANDVIDLLEKHKMSWPFRRAVDFNSHPKYLRIVQEPMDLSMVKLKTNERRYHCLAEFTNDVSLIFNNARKYFPPEHAEFQCATVLDRYFSDRLHEIKQEMIKEIKN